MPLKRVLVVDDDRSMAEFIAACLAASSFAVDAACDGAAALAMVRAWEPDLIVLDLMMPDMHGFDVCEALRKDGAFRGKILISSGKAYEVDKKAAKRLGADDYITKPFTIEQLMAAVNGLIGA